MKPVDVNSSTYIDFGIENNGKDLKLRLVSMQEYQNKKVSL